MPRCSHYRSMSSLDLGRLQYRFPAISVRCIPLDVSKKDKITHSVRRRAPRWNGLPSLACLDSVSSRPISLKADLDRARSAGFRPSFLLFWSGDWEPWCECRARGQTAMLRVVIGCDFLRPRFLRHQFYV